MADQADRRLGRFYTPAWLAEPLVDWALPDEGRMLDPSFGGCAFLEAGLRHLQRRSTLDVGHRIFGVDIDPKALNFARSLVSQGVPATNMLVDDFLTGRVFRSIGTFEAVVGNPPYLRHHILDDAAIEEAQRVTSEFLSLPKLSSAWAYFTILSTELITMGGKLSFILPGSLLHSNYGAQVVRYLTERFSSVTLLHIPERLFRDTNEESVIVLGDERLSRGEGSLKYERVPARAVPTFLSTYKRATRPHVGSYKQHLLSPAMLEAWADVRAKSDAVPLGAVATIRIGVVTGANGFFIRAPGDQILTQRTVRTRSIVTRNAFLHTPNFDRSAMDRLQRSGSRCKLAIIRGPGRSGSLIKRAIDAAERDGIHLRHHCSKRRPWYAIRDFDTPDIFLPYLQSFSPHLVKNGARVLCTNAIHRVDLHDSSIANAVVSSSYSTLFKFECEYFGRHYGGSILKVEPSAAKRLSVTTTGDLMKQIEACDDEVTRYQLVNRYYIRKHSVTPHSLDLLRRATEVLRKHRARIRISDPDC